MIKSMSRKVFLIAFLMATIFQSVVHATETLKMATTTSTYETGLLDFILPPFEQKHDTKVHVISVGTGKALRLGANGDVDVVLVHARKAEDDFIASGNGINRRDVMYNDFVILGPSNDPAEIAGVLDITKALRSIMEKQAIFVSRGDDSGTHKKEKSMWQKANIVPEGNWYLETGQGMSATLKIADEKRGYLLIDRAAYLANKDKMELDIMVEGDQHLYNPYGVIAVNPYKHGHVKYESTMTLIAWLTSPQCQELIREYKKHGQQLFQPNAANPIE